MSAPDALEIADTKVQRIAELSKLDPNICFYSLIHHYNIDSLYECFKTIDGKKAIGIDGVTKDEYKRDLRKNLEELIAKMKSMSYRPGPVRQVLIPKSNGKMRPLGISNFEDKIIQMRTGQLLNSIYDPIFIEDSYGFRRGRSCHMAVKALSDHLYKNEVETVIDIDLASFFDTIDHSLLVEILQEKIKDTRFIRYIQRMLKAGVLTKGELKRSDTGTPQGSICSPILANIFAHYVIDKWIEETIKPQSRGRVRLFRYADDQVICCEYEEDALKVREAMASRLNQYKLTLNEEKTKLTPFSKTKTAKGIKQGTFDFLGFTFYLGKSKRGFIIPKIKPCGKSICEKLKKIDEWIKATRNSGKLSEIWNRFRLKLNGSVRYYGISHTTKYVEIYLTKATGIIFKWINRRSQRRSMT